MIENNSKAGASGAVPLSFLKQDAAPGTVNPWLLVLLHGVGSNEEDLFGLASHVPPNFHVLSLRAPNVMGHGSYAWFQFGVSPQGQRVIHQAQEAASRRLVAQTLATLSEQLGVPPERVVIGGFSQGGIMSLSLLLTQPELVHGAMVLHSRLLDEVLPFVAPGAQLQGKQLWVSGGNRDQVLPIVHSRSIREHVQKLPLTLRYTEFPSAHEITPDELTAAMQWLRQLAA
ncbi:MAG: alpha/beta fold hydrolase [Polaromonas sp.]|uniref:alpha/beta hydrolase n=1 Tax=Polaromonas sp. TaxID=1869339 RepID=UPI0027376D17|nr:alpha/beta fold hydrolase [Polaromonas sp.]MDP3798725.1 alpha/beta fold hydrolase [Polaromonas sp.]